MLEWDKTTERYYHHGVDRGVLYPSGADPVVWNGITGVDEPGNGASTLYYIDGQVYLADVDATDFSAKLKTYGWPEEFAKCIGIPETTDGFYADNQKPKQFGLSYRSLIGSGSAGDMFGYQIHLIYKAMAVFNGNTRTSINNTPAPEEYEFDLACTPVALPGFRPTAHYIIDTRHLVPETIASLEAILYGSDETPGRLPDPTELFDMLNFGSAITFVTWTHPELGPCWTATGAYANVHMTNDTDFVINNVNGTNHGDGTYDLVDTP